MTNTPRLSKSGIEYLDYQWGVFSGCHNLERGICPVENCWARSLTQRFRGLYPNGFEPTFYPDALDSPPDIKQPSRIGVGWVGDIIGYGSFCREQVYRAIRVCPWHTFLFLTKNPGSLKYWEPFPDNCHVGVTVCTNGMMSLALQHLSLVKARVKYISFEPLLGAIGMNDHMSLKGVVDWIVIGAQTKPKWLPRWEWVREIIESCDKLGIAVFLKNNLGLPKYTSDGAMPFYKRHPSGTMELRQEILQK